MIIRPVFPFRVADARPLRLADRDLDVTRFDEFTAFLAAEKGDACALVGGWGEDRSVYAGSTLFDEASADADDEPRTIHLGLDIWCEAGTPVAAPLPARVHSFADNDRLGDYGGTVILELESRGEVFFTLYGHLARRTLTGLQEGRAIAAGEVFAWVGGPAENGGWPPHLHFQRIGDMQGRRGDFPGVARASEKEQWLTLCPDPTDLLL